MRVRSIVTVITQQVELPSLEPPRLDGVAHWFRNKGFSDGLSIQYQPSVADFHAVSGHSNYPAHHECVETAVDDDLAAVRRTRYRPVRDDRS